MNMEMFKDVAMLAVGSVGGSFASNWLKDNVDFLKDYDWAADALLVVGGIFLASKFRNFEKLGYGVAVGGMTNLVNMIFEKFAG